MKTVKIFYAGIPTKNNNAEKVDVLRFFHMGVTGAPETFLVNNGKIIAHYRGEVNEMIWSDVFSPIIKQENIFNVN